MEGGDCQPDEGEKKTQYEVGDYPFSPGSDNGEVNGEHREQHGGDKQCTDDIPDTDNGRKQYGNEDGENCGNDQAQPYGFYPVYGSLCPAQNIVTDGDGGQ